MINLVAKDQKNKSHDSKCSIKWKQLRSLLFINLFFFSIKRFSLLIFLLLYRSGLFWVFRFFNSLEFAIVGFDSCLRSSVNERLSDAISSLVHNLTQGNARNHADDWSQSKHQSDHDTREVSGEDTVDCNKNLSKCNIFAQAVVVADRQEEDQIPTIKEVIGPRSWLMLRD